MPATMKVSQINLLKLLDSAEYGALKGEFKERRFPKKTLITTPYGTVDQVFIVKSGRIRVYLSYEAKEFTLALLEAGDIFSSHSEAFVQAFEECELLIADTSRFQSRVMEFPQVAPVMVKVLGELLKNSFSIIEGLVFKDVRVRLADFLTAAAKDKGRSVQGGIVVDLGLSTEDMAQLIGATRQTVSMLMNDLLKTGIIEKKDRRSLLIKKPEELPDWPHKL